MLETRKQSKDWPVLPRQVIRDVAPFGEIWATDQFIKRMHAGPSRDCGLPQRRR